MNFRTLHKSLLTTLCFMLLTSIIYGNITRKRQGAKIYKGYVVTISGDTLHGKVQMLSPTMNQVKVKFIGKNKKKVTYKPKDIQSYAFVIQEWDKATNKNVLKWIFYAKKTVERPPVPFSSTEVLIQQEINGLISTYNYYIETRTSQNLEHLIYVEKDGVLYEINKKNYRKVLKKITQDVTQIHEKVGTKGYTYRNIETTIKSYNSHVLKEESETINEGEIEG